MVNLFTDVWREQEVLRQYAVQDQRYERARQAVTPELADRMVALSRLRPNAMPGVVSSFALAGASDDQFAQAVDSAPPDSSEMNWFERSIAGAATAAATPFRGAYEQGIKPLVRGAFTLMDTAAQELVQRPLTAAFASSTDPGTSFGEAYRDYGNSTGVVAAKSLFDAAVDPDETMLETIRRPDDPGTEGTDESFLGQGFFAGGQVGEESYNQRTLTVQGQRANLFRSLHTTQAMAAGGEFVAEQENLPSVMRSAGRMISPGESAYNVVTGIGQFAADVFLDPTVLLTGGSSAVARAAKNIGVVSEGSAAARVLESGVVGARQAARRLDPEDATRLADELASQAGAIDNGSRQTVLLEKATEFLGDDDLLDALAQADAYTIWRSMSRSKARTVDLDTVRAIGESTDKREIAELLLRQVGAGNVTAQGFYKGTGTFHRMASAIGGRTGLRDALQLSPRGTLHADDLDGSLQRIDSWLGQMKVDDTQRAEVFRRGLDVDTNDDLLDVLDDAVRRPLFDEGIEADELETLTRVVAELKEETAAAGRLFGTDNAARPTRSAWSRVDELKDGDVAIAPTPELLSELAQGGFQLPDVHVLRRAIKRRTNLHKVYQSRGWEVPNNAFRYLTRDVFKPWAILRPAYIVRIGLEEQARLAAAGMDSMLNHPIRYVTANLRNRDELKDLTGTSLLETAQRSHVVVSDATGILDDMGRSSVTGTRVWTGLPKAQANPKTFAGAWRRELAQLGADPAVRTMVKNNFDADAVVDWARNSDEGRRWVERMSRINDDSARILSTDDGIRQWVRETAAPRVHLKTGGQVDRATGQVTRPGRDDLIEALGDASILDESIGWDGKLMRRLDDAPDYVKFEHAAGKGNQQRAQVVDWLFEHITGKPTSYLARFPAYRQLMVKNVTDLIDTAASRQVVDDIVQAAKANLKLTKDELRKLTAAADNAGGGGLIESVDEFNELVKGRSVQEVRDLLFDTTRRSNLQEKYEVIFPFFDAWKEVTQTWSRLATENPAFIMRAMQGYQSLEEGGAISVNDFGDKVFSYPGGGALANFITGGTGQGGTDTTIDLQARVQGANIVAQGVGPGFGPLVQWTVGSMPFMDTEGFREIREFLTPYGSDIEDSSDFTIGGFAESFAPAWLEKIMNAVSKGAVDERQWNSTAGDVMKVLAVSGNYDPGDPDDQQRLLRDARSGARTILMMRGITQGVAITGPNATWKVEADGKPTKVDLEWDHENDPDGHWFTIGAMQGAYYDLLEETGWDSDMATARFVERYGIQPWYITQAKTRSIGNQPVTAEGNYWIRRNREAADKYKSTIGYFVPADDNSGEMDFSVYSRQLRDGTRQSLTAEQMLHLANRQRAYAMYNQVRNQLDASEVAGGMRTSVLSRVKAILEDEYPGWQDDVLGIESALDTEGRIRELERAAADPLLEDSPVTPTLRTYLDARRTAQSIAEQRGTGLSSQQNADLRTYLREVGRILMNDNKDFAGVWDRVLRREVDDE